MGGKGLTRTVPISLYELVAFIGNVVPFNFRPPQKLQSHKFLANFRPEAHEGGEEESEGGHHIQITDFDHLILYLLKEI